LGVGQFSWSDTRLTAASLALFSVSVVAQSLILLFVRGYYAAGQTKKPLIIGTISGLSIIAISYIFVKIFMFFPMFQYFIESLFRVSDIQGTSVLMLSLGYTIGIFINCILLWVCLNKEFPGFTRSLSGTIFESFSSSVIAGAVAYLGLNIFVNFFDIDTVIGIFMQGFLAGIMGIIAGVAILILLKNHELQEIWITLHHKIWKAKPIPAEVSEL
jgi:peptidoglycan biosynthesis protein MviN/MurJ (putative lipid II flippase)